MRRQLIGLLMALAATPALAQAPPETRARCMAPDPEAKIAGCTAVIVSGLENASNLAVAYSNRSDAEEVLGLHDRAIADATTAIQLNPSRAAAYNARAWAYHGKGEDAEGLPDAEKAVQLAPGDPYILETRAEIYERLGRRDAALVDYRASAAIAPGLKEAQDGLRRLGAGS
jgi:tetratricopeptide (TPR) repeat protein